MQIITLSESEPLQCSLMLTLEKAVWLSEDHITNRLTDLVPPVYYETGTRTSGRTGPMSSVKTVEENVM